MSDSDLQWVEPTQVIPLIENISILIETFKEEINEDTDIKSIMLLYEMYFDVLNSEDTESFEKFYILAKCKNSPFYFCRLIEDSK